MDDELRNLGAAARPWFFQDVMNPAARGSFLNSVAEIPTAAPAHAQQNATARTARVATPLVLAGLTFFAAVIQGYHPYADDAGIYVSGVNLALHPNLYRSSAAFITAYTHLSIFAHLVAAIVRLLHAPLPYVLFGIQLFTTWLVIYSCWLLAQKCFTRPEARWGAVALVTACLTMPVAGSALFMMDPYVTSRSFSTPLTLLAIDAVLDRRWPRVLLWLALVGLFHPLMAIYAAAFVLLLWTVQAERWLLVSALCATSVILGAALQFSQRNITESPDYRTAVLTRSYFYLSCWQWYELFGLVAPLILMALYCCWQKWDFRKPGVSLCGACLAIGISSITVSLLFVHPQSHSHFIARLQTLRPFLLLYFILFLGLGGLLGQYLLKQISWRWAVTLLGLATVMIFVQYQTYPATAHYEFPCAHSSNPWNQAFLWIRNTTPTDALFALDANYIRAQGEDTLGFRATAQRDSLADNSKDGGAASVFPQLAQKWMVEHTAETDLSHISDAKRIQRLAPFGVNWLVLQRNANTAFVCPFQNAAVKVCQLPRSN